MLLWAQQVARRRIAVWTVEIRDMAQVERLHESGDLE